ncbi:helix-turn-helix transcriptional regulator [Treponema sp.]|uniref:helix-turn-helix transcriptional regulator n=1 Tax=Treponema sp. TaxID=166 RepID=UPI003890068E
MSFWTNVELLREEQNTSYRWLAKIMGVSETTVSSMRKADTEPRASQAVKIALALGTTVEFLVGEVKISEGQTVQTDLYLKKYITLKENLKSLVENS